jgi:hypothetical protein
MIENCPEADIQFDAPQRGYEPDEFREMMTEMAWNLVTPSEG